ncbi:Bax inhibitor-1/YccA family protein [Geomonas subterranea]|uniref:Bax inhibitor-1/YccA family protein n=1 Tax=Geomonas subterranea TaxID=2847989 RepID=A0ABX8LKV1_9BACT|nr:Bax inhibitor-1/YccA family protein [Geomonas subterranea]QXE91991.1 Bax inhibitor-1/YccA family protein [Geomonas subterranea]QXM09916.1 Bax inhibitor-1/YccA family protein [Geomonas subterranea]
MERYQTQYRTITVVNSGVMRGVYGWMSGGLLLTALVSVITASTPALLQAILGNRILFYALLFGELGLVVAISGAINRISTAAASLLFLLYAALNGLTMSTIFVAYTHSSIASTFLVTAGMFGAMSLYGYLTRSDLSSWGSFLFMGLVGVVIASLVNIFLHSSMLNWVLSLCGIIVFTGLTAYDTQRIKQMGNSGGKGAILGALTLYLDFINMFLLLLRFLGDRR